MALADWDAYRAAQAAPYQRIVQTKGSLTVGAALELFSMWLQTPFAGAAPTTAVVPNNTTAGCLLQNDAATVQRALRTQIITSQQQIWTLCDRLSHQGGLSGTDTSAQTTNLPTAALTRYTAGDNVHAGLEVYTAIGGTATTVTCSYTNQAGTAGRTSQAVAFGGGGTANDASRMFPVDLQQGDSGVRSVESVTVLATTGTVGNFGVTLYKPLFHVPLVAYHLQNFYDQMVGLASAISNIENGACLFWLVRGLATSTGLTTLEVDLHGE